MDPKLLKVGFVGAGAIHFGGAEGPWDHATRLEKISGVEVVGIADPLIKKAKQVLDARKSGPGSKIYKSCQIFASVSDMITAVKLDAVFIGTPPVYRGAFDGNKDIELMCVKAGIHVFIEKPISVADPQEFNKYVAAVVKAQHEMNLVVSVGYMFRYHAAVRKMKQLISEHGGKVMAFNGRYYLAYSELDHAFWWNVEKSGGPIVEQATHFCDLARFIVGDIDLQSIKSTCLPATDISGNLSKIVPGMEDGLKPNNRVPRVTSAQWRFTDGGVGTLMHTVALHGKRYESQIDVILDGLRMTLYEPYHPECKLLVRDGKSGNDYEVALDYGNDDPYASEIKCFIDAVKGCSNDAVACSYSDAAKTHEFAWAIRHASSD